MGITTSEVREGAAKLAETPLKTLPVTSEKQQHRPGPLRWSAVPLRLCSVTAALVTVFGDMNNGKILPLWQMIKAKAASGPESKARNGFYGIDLVYIPFRSD